MDISGTDNLVEDLITRRRQIKNNLLLVVSQLDTDDPEKIRAASDWLTAYSKDLLTLAAQMPRKDLIGWILQ